MASFRKIVESWTGVGDEERVIDVELAGITKSLSVGEAPGPDGVPHLALKVAIAEAEMFRPATQKCLDERVFPKVWKRQSLVLSPKAGKPPGNPSDNMLDRYGGKVLEKITLNRILRHTEGVNGLSSNQFGFRRVIVGVDRRRYPFRLQTPPRYRSSVREGEFATVQ